MMDGIVILLLAGTIFYAIKLSEQIKVFRDSRKDLEKLIGNLSAQIDKAGQAIEGLREAARLSGRDLQSCINDAQGLSEELQIMIQSGNNLAERLEKGAEQKGRSHKERSHNVLPSRAVRKHEPESRPAPFAGFSIRDPDYDEGGMDVQGLMPEDYEDDSAGSFGSRAERELYEALKKKNKAKAGAGGIT
ncbi:MAG: hypothetical protein CO093_01470 [Alphaproteobacteria bacterium CG_4_9_14_3_um_filter_47_13]|nr:MAG: hypothetical protein CO093_01470 [Alphaproteobacteria bacterium CG_4_9_14_3_um_filter_47_13]